jgi:hypothetical protein
MCNHHNAEREDIMPVFDFKRKYKDLGDPRKTATLSFAKS